MIIAALDDGFLEPIPKTWASPKSSNFAGWQERKMATYLRIFCRFSDAARLQKSRLQAAKVFGIDSTVNLITFVPKNAISAEIFHRTTLKKSSFLTPGKVFLVEKRYGCYSGHACWKHLIG
ncbi:MAG TPA: hypothetical protein PKK48_01930 [Phycisphaerae bacterium]|nr:hypothetical protein [Phycisphaerae bacterium]